MYKRFYALRYYIEPLKKTWKDWPMTEEDELCPECKRVIPFCTCTSSPAKEASSQLEKPPERKMFYLPRREFPRIVIGENECRICGMPLENTACPMCGWSAKDAVVDDERDYLCPFCNAKLGEGGQCTECGRTMEDLEGDESEYRTPIDFSCPICLKNMRLVDDLCPHCGAQIWFAKKCPNCDFEVWIGGQDGIAGTVLEVVKDAEFQLEYGRKEGANLDKLASMVSEARKKFEEGDLRKAEKMAELAAAAAKTTLLQFKMFEDARRKALRIREESARIGDSSEVDSILEDAYAQAEVGEYKTAMRMALRAAILAEKIRDSKTLGFTK
jgi:hypothetical protein